MPHLQQHARSHSRRQWHLHSLSDAPRGSLHLAVPQAPNSSSVAQAPQSSPTARRRQQAVRRHPLQTARRCHRSSAPGLLPRPPKGLHPVRTTPSAFDEALEGRAASQPRPAPLMSRQARGLVLVLTALTLLARMARTCTCSDREDAIWYQEAALRPC